MAISATHEATLACVFGDDEAARAALGGLLAAGVSCASVRVGARDPARAAALAGESGARCDVDPADPLRGMPGLEPPDSRGVDRGAALGGVAGALAGLALGLSPVAGVVPVAPSMRLLADCLLLFVLGMIAGAVLGGALGPQASKHAGFRLIDEMEDGAVVVIAKAPPQLVDASERALRAAGCRQLLRLPRS